jgi:hypothetical protein
MIRVTPFVGYRTKYSIPGNSGVPNASQGAKIRRPSGSSFLLP